MAIVTLEVYCVLSVIAVAIYRKISHPTVIFNLIWTVLIAVSRLGLVGLSVPSPSSYEIFLKGGICFNLVALFLYFVNRFLHQNPPAEIKKGVLSDKRKQSILLSLNLIMFVYYMIKLFQIRGILGEGSYLDVRSFYYSTDNFSSSLEYNIVLFVFDSTIYLNAIFFALNIKKKHCHTYLLVLIFINMILRTVISGGRMIMMEFAVCLVITLVTPVDKKKPRKNVKKRFSAILMMSLVIMLFFVAAYITELRGGSGSSLAENGLSTLISNFTGSFSYFSLMNRYDRYLNPLYGRAIFAGFIDPVIMILHFLGLTNVEITQNSIGLILSQFYVLGKHSYNAMPTMYYFFISDFGKSGVFIGPALLAVYSFLSERMVRHYNSYKSFAFYLMMLLTIIESSMTWLPFRSSFAVALLLIPLLISNEKFDLK